MAAWPDWPRVHLTASGGGIIAMQWHNESKPSSVAALLPPELITRRRYILSRTDGGGRGGAGDGYCQAGRGHSGVSFVCFIQLRLVIDVRVASAATWMNDSARLPTVARSLATWKRAPSNSEEATKCGSSFNICSFVRLFVRPTRLV